MEPVLLVGGTVLTMDPRQPRASGLLLAGDRIVAVGGSDELRSLADRHTRVVELDGRTVIPGFNDAHCHALMFGLTLAQLDLKAPHVSSIVDVQRLVRERARSTAAGGWIRGWGYDQTKLAEGRHPKRVELDSAAPDQPVSSSTPPATCTWPTPRPSTPRESLLRRRIRAAGGSSATPPASSPV
jgi:predicted amidohydrolase YtcJ